MSTLTATILNRVRLGAALTATESFIRRFVVLTREQSTLIALWVAQTHALAVFDYVAYLHIQSPLPECGKTRLLEVLEALVAKPWLTGRVTAAVLMRKVDAEHPTLLLDESDAAFKGDPEYTEGLRGMLNSGFQRSGKSSTCVGQGANLTYKDFSTFSPKAVAGIGRLPSTVESRSIPIALKRRTKHEAIEKWRRRTARPVADVVRTELADAVGAALPMDDQGRYPDIPDGLSDRAEDVLEPLFTIADAAGGDWPTRARASAVALMGYAARQQQETDQHLALELLADIRAIFAAENNPEALATKDIIAGLVALDDRPWATFSKDKPITGHKLSRHLKGFDVQPAKRRDGDATFRGYLLADFAEPFARYLPSKVEQVEQPNNDGPKHAKTNVEHAGSVPHSKSAVSPDKHCAVPLVPLSTPDTGARDGDEGDETEPSAQCCKGGELRLHCKLCRLSPTYWQPQPVPS